MSEPSDGEKVPQLIEITLPGWVPSKKNLLKVNTRTGRGYYDPEVKERLLEMEAAVREQWAGRPPLVHPAIAMFFALASGRSDRDNKWTTVLDCLVKGGALEDDCVLKSNGPYLVTPAIVSPTPFCTVWLQPDGDVKPLVAKLDDIAFLTQLPTKPTLKKKKGTNRWRAT